MHEPPIRALLCTNDHHKEVSLITAFGSAETLQIRRAEVQDAEAILAAAQSQRRLVTDALVRIERGVYGVCADCGSAIPEGRLDARPEAARCVGCQGKRDRRH